MVTDGAIVTFASRDSTGFSFGPFCNVTTSTGRVATAEFTPAGSGVSGTANFTVRVEGTALSAAAAFELVDPN